MLKRGTSKCPKCKVPLLIKQAYGMAMVREVIPDRPKHPYYVYDTKCPSCDEEYEVKK